MEYHKKISNVNPPAGGQISNRSGIVFGFLLVCLIYYIIKSAVSSIFLKGNDKINVVFYGKNTRLYSIDVNDTDYILTFPPTSKVLIPGGYGKYRLGAMGKLSSLDRDPDLIKRAMSSATSSFVDLYFYFNSEIIFYEDSGNHELFPTLKEFFLSKSNANLIDRFFVFVNLSNRNKNFYKIINISDNFSEENFSKNYQGSFYSKILREEGENLQVRYQKSYQTAKIVSRIIEGEGIRVVDLSESKNALKNCRLVVKNEKKLTKTVKTLANFFHCQIISGETEISDIILELGDLEEKWAIE
ncbi:MAG: hypothetical protein UR68_C0012G0042 [Candidatus Roizmanbacteria bacterium GW2011_GWA2_35_19]|uniref:LytR/CpsA/Psr regulator C-terminal domain-containing protein n=1 Tax=Candidatus Roizmanbacteria bacterium GW2011_GWA2_35_19 TaxID=1618478 RepID=A0A0G0BTR0_9BACT|nr:MAG: hypothetical protein UR68_C0012G0042 [Candidatus Roizmanbacteria bacterium GW2011_GWA2_35_19]